MTYLRCNRFVVPADPAAVGAAWCRHAEPLFQASVSENFDVGVPIAMTTWKIRDVIVSDVVNPAQQLERTGRMIARQGLDHVLLQFQERGTSLVRTSDRRSVVEPRQLVVFDLARPVSVEASAGGSVTVLVPRRLMPGGGGLVAGLHGKAFDYESDPAKLLFHTYLRSLVETGDRLLPHHLSGVSQAASQLCAACFNAEEPLQTASDAGVNIAIRQYIHQELASKDLGIETIITHFGVSRATLYRLFQEDGGVIKYIRDRRLAKAMSLLTDRGDFGRPRVSAVAYATGFTDEKTFSRAFKRRYGFVPREADIGLPAIDPSSIGRTNDNPSELLHWIKTSAA